MTPDDFRKRTTAFALRGIRVVDALPKSTAGWVIGKQLLRCATSVGANYRAACRAKSRADFVAKMRIVEEECDETLYWIELVIESNLLKATLLQDLIREGNEIMSLVVASIKTARARNARPPANKKSPISNPQSPMVERKR